jgi:hypothetical protein
MTEYLASIAFRRRQSARRRALALVPVFIATVGVSAHRLDEYLQAARLGIDPDKVELSLDLTPGVAVAAQVLADIDLDRDKSISAAEAERYAQRLVDAIRLDVDGRPLRLALVDYAAPTAEAVMRGEGTLRLRALAALPPLSSALHHLRYRNTTRPDIGAYLANALIPASDRVVITDQRRNDNQQELTIDYMVRADPTNFSRRWPIVAPLGAVLGLAAWWQIHARRRRTAVASAARAAR